MTPKPQYRFRGSVVPSAEVKRPVAARRHAPRAAVGGSGTASNESTTSATIDIFDVIDSYGGWWGISAREVDRALARVGDVDVVYVRINSPGGEGSEGVAIANLLRAHKAEVRVTVYGLAASAASYIATAGNSVAMAPGSMMMVHDAWAFAIGPADELKQAVQMLDAVSDSVASLYALKAGGTTDEWRAVMKAERWYTADAAVEAKLADHIGLDPQLPDAAATDPDTDPADEITDLLAELDDLTAYDLSAARFDLSVFNHAPAAKAPKTPADTPVTPPTRSKEEGTMPDTIPTAGLVKALALASDADEDTILEAVEARVTATQADPEITHDAIAKAFDITPEQAKAAIDGAKTGKVTVSQALLDELTAGAKAGQSALERQSREDRDAAIAKAQADGKIGRNDTTVESWRKAWDRDPAGTAKELDELAPRFPVAKAPGYQGGEPGTGSDTAISEAEAAVIAAQLGVDPKELTRA